MCKIRVMQLYDIHCQKVNTQVLASKCKLYLPSEEELLKELNREYQAMEAAQPDQKIETLLVNGVDIKTGVSHKKYDLVKIHSTCCKLSGMLYYKKYLSYCTVVPKIKCMGKTVKK